MTPQRSKESAQNRGRLRSPACGPIVAGLSTDREQAMKLIIEARLVGDGDESTNMPISLAVSQRHDDDLEQLGLSLADGRELLAATQSALVSSQASVWVSTQDYCHECYTPLRRKDSRSIAFCPITRMRLCRTRNFSIQAS